MSALHRSRPHESAALHVTGAARYVDDLSDHDLVYGFIVASTQAHARIVGKDGTAARRLPGIHAVVFAEDLADPLIGPISHDEPVLATDTVQFYGQALAVVYGDSIEACRAAAAAVVVQTEPLPAALSIDDAIAADSWHGVPHVIARGDLDEAFADAPLVLEGVCETGAQDHFYLETHAAQASVDEHGNVLIHSSTQHPTEAQKMAARVLGVPASTVVCTVPRLGGGFGGKESQSTNYAVLAAVGAVRTGRPCRVRLDRAQDMAWTGKRHAFRGAYRAAFDADGRLRGLDVKLWADGGWVTDLSHPVLDRALFHLDNAYYVPALRFEGKVCRTHLPSATAFRGFGGPQGVVVIETILERAAFALKLRPEAIRRLNYYDTAPRDTAPYGQLIPDPRTPAMHDRLVQQASLDERRAQISHWNSRARFSRRGIGLVPVKFGISFTKALLNQAGALVHVYTDGSVQLNHGGTEMGQGLHTKMQAVAADIFGVDLATVRVMTTATDKVPNTSPTAASSGSDLNGAAVTAACTTVRDRMAKVAAEELDCRSTDLVWSDGRVSAGDRSLAFSDLANTCWVRQVSLSSTGYYATPGIAYDHGQGAGTPFFYFAYGVGISEVEVCGLTGEARLRRVDVLHDVGDALVPSIDKGQVEGAFVQGLGWLTDEEVLYGSDGRCLTVGPSTYKVPSIGDIPVDFRVDLLDRAPQPGVVGGSKAVGEPPFMLAISALSAIRDAVGAFGDREVELTVPATPEAILRAVEAQKASKP